MVSGRRLADLVTVGTVLEMDDSPGARFDRAAVQTLAVAAHAAGLL